MIGIFSNIIDIFLFSTLYFEVFMLVTYLENRKNIKKEVLRSGTVPTHFPTVTIFVPVWNVRPTSAQMNSCCAVDLGRRLSRANSD